MTISLRLISRLKNAVASLCLMAAERAKSSASVDLPTAGRAAMMIIWPPCNPLVRLSNDVKPVGTPLSPPPRAPMASISS